MTPLGRQSPLLAAFVAILSALTALGVAIWLMTMPWYTALAAPGQVDTVGAGLPAELMVDLAEQVRAFVTDGSAPALPAVVEGREAFDDSAVSHLIDVRNVLLAGRWATVVSAALLLVAGLWAGSTGHGEDVTAGFKWGGLALIGGVGLLLLAGLLDFDSFFTAFHGVFFEEGTWTFPMDSLLIQIFPIGFWTLAAAITGVVTTTLAIVLLLMGRMNLSRA